MKGQWGKLVGYVLATLVVSAAITLLPPLVGGRGWLPELISTEGKKIDELFWGLMIMSIVIFALVGGVVVYCMVQFRAGPGDLSDGDHIHGNAKMEVAWIVVPSIIVLVIGILSYIVLEENEVGLYDKAAAKKPGAAQMVVDVRGFSFGWAFRYEDLEDNEISEAGPSSELVLPVDKVVRFNVLSCSGKEHLGSIYEQSERELDAGDEEHEFAEIEPGICEREWDETTEEDRIAAEEDAVELHEIQQKREAGEPLTKEQELRFDELPRFRGDRQFVDVNHAFWVPEARLKIDAVYGLRTYVQWQASRLTGPDDNFQVVCAELCGSGHNGMRTDMCVVPSTTYDWWTGLDEEERGVATCANLRLMNCLEDQDPEELLPEVAALSEEQPDATCDDVEEKI